MKSPSQQNGTPAWLMVPVICVNSVPQKDHGFLGLFFFHRGMGLMDFLHISGDTYGKFRKNDDPTNEMWYPQMSQFFIRQSQLGHSSERPARLHHFTQWRNNMKQLFLIPPWPILDTLQQSLPLGKVSIETL